MWDWLSVRPGRAFSERQLEDAGFFSHWGSSDLEPYVDDTEYSFHRLLFASGSDKRFASRGYHASADDRGGHQSFWPIDFNTMKSHQAEETLDEMAEWCSEIETDLEVHRSPNEKGMRMDVLYDSRAQARYLDNLHLACTRRMDKFFRVRCPGACGDSSASTQLRTDVVKFVYSPRGQRLRASIGNGLHPLAGESVAKEMMFLKSMLVSSISQAGTWLEKHLRAFRLEKDNLPDELEEEEWLVQQQDGIFLARRGRLDASGEEIDHVVVVDSRKQLDYDLAECVALKMGSVTLRACLGDGVDLLGIPELRRLTKQPKGKRKRHKGTWKVSLAVQRERKGIGQGKKPFTSASSRPTRRVVLDEE